MSAEIWEFMVGGQHRVMRQWFEKECLSAQERAKLDKAVERLRTLDFALISHKLLAGPLRGGTKLYKLRVRCGSHELRPLLCRGPIGDPRDYTFLLGAIEDGPRLRPRDAEDRALENKGDLLQNHNWRARY